MPSNIVRKEYSRVQLEDSEITLYEEVSGDLITIPLTICCSQYKSNRVFSTIRI